MSEMRLGQLERALGSFREGAATLETFAAAGPRRQPRPRADVAHEHVGDVLGIPIMQNPAIGPRLQAYRQAASRKTAYELDRSDQRAASDYGIVLSQVETAMRPRFLQKRAVQGIAPRSRRAAEQPRQRDAPDLSCAGPPSSRGHADCGRKSRGRRLAYLIRQDHRALLEARTRVAARAVHAIEPASRVERRHPGEEGRRAGIRRTRVAHKRESVGRCPVGASWPARAFGNGADLCGAHAEPDAPAGRPGGRSFLAAQSCRRVAYGSVR